MGPLLAWRKTSTESLKRNFGWPLGTGLFAGVVAFALGFRELFSLICLILRIFVASTIGLEFYRGAKVIRARSGASFVASTVDLTMRNTRRYGGYIVHVGMVFVFIGLSGAAFNRDTQKEMQLGQNMQIGPYTLQLQGFDTKPEKNYTAERMIVEVLRDNKSLMMLYPEKRKFATTDQNGTMVAIYSTLKEDLYVVFAGMSPDTQLPVMHAYLNPLIKWIWFGGAFVVFGTIVALSRCAGAGRRATARCCVAAGTSAYAPPPRFGKAVLAAPTEPQAQSLRRKSTNLILRRDHFEG